MRIAFVAGTSLVVLGIACSSSSSSNGSGGPPTDTTTFGDDYCAILEPCCADAGLSTTGTTCRAFVTVAAGQGTYDPAKGEACIQAMQQASSSADFCQTLGGSSVTAVCNGVFGNGSSGGKQPGQTCQADTDCAPAPGAGGGALCLIGTTDGGSAQTCVQTMPGKAGDTPCVGTVSGAYTEFGPTGPLPTQGFLCNIADGVRCDSSTHACLALKNVGDPCTGSEDCVETAYCTYGTGASGGQCTARVPDGGSCAGALAGACLPTSSCDSASMTCKARSPDGAPCTSGSTCQSDICINGACGTSAGTGLGLSLLCGKS